MEQNRKNIRMALIALAVLIIAAGAVTIASSGLASAKYKKEQVATAVPVTVNVSADLAQTLEVKEHLAVRQTSGKYELNIDQNDATKNLTTTNTYFLMPGVDIPKDPKVYITQKTSVPAFLYVEVIDTTGLSGGENPVFSYSLTNEWTNLNISGRNVYVYNTTLQPAAETDYVIPILEGDSITVTSALNLNDGYSGTLQFKAYMAQAADTAAEIFRTQLAND